ncbi:MAG: DUF2452 domain-containing protein [Chitinophagaceae bacterium]|jgi:hypothetical protein
MVQAYNFLASWQLFPEKCNYQFGTTPKSGIYKIDSLQQGKLLGFTLNWISQDGEAFYSQYNVLPNGEKQPFDNQDFADSITAEIVNASTLCIAFYKEDKEILKVTHEILANGFLKLSQQGIKVDGESFINVEVYHKQLSVLPYASSAGSVAIRPTKEGVIKHKALAAMEEQTNMHLNQIKEQIELLARQAQDIRKRRELSMMIYEAKLNFKPQIGQTYHLYERRDDSHILSLVAPTEWGGAGPFKQFVSSVQLLADHTWKEV